MTAFALDRIRTLVYSVVSDGFFGGAMNAVTRSGSEDRFYLGRPVPGFSGELIRVSVTPGTGRPGPGVVEGFTDLFSALFMKGGLVAILAESSARLAELAQTKKSIAVLEQELVRYRLSLGKSEREVSLLREDESALSSKVLDLERSITEKNDAIEDLEEAADSLRAENKLLSGPLASLSAAALAKLTELSTKDLAVQIEWQLPTLQGEAGNCTESEERRALGVVLTRCVAIAALRGFGLEGVVSDEQARILPPAELPF